MRKEDLKNWTADRLKDEIINLSDKNFNLECIIKQFEKSEGRWKCEIESLRTENERLNVDNAAYSSANSMYKEHLEVCELKNKHLFETNGKLEAENKALKQRIKDLEDVCNNYEPQFAPDDDISAFNYECIKRWTTEMNYKRRIHELQDQHQQDCITINQLHTTIDTLVDKYARLRKNVGMD